MLINALPPSDLSVNTTGCCARFNPMGWDGQRLHFRHKPFVRATSRSVLHVPLNMGAVFARVQARMAAAGIADPDNTIVLSRDLSPWESEHLFAADRRVPDEEMTTLSGDFLTRVFEGPYDKLRDWHAEMQDLAQGGDGDPARVYFYFTTCPKCAKAYGRNFVVGVAEVGRPEAAIDG
ncbi:hydrolase [Rhodobacter ferrooxidans]|uniref:Uncharacterized protein n=1 Tax=Rhodobacter ferrooxidans TaxID=371731 RepID=C8S3M4_9RHOB|nr:hydrolase [Rhodobacter sp. SW2]EEW24472.1 conserved hypothetical protein [Rhodobacter sp. SW2]